MKIGIFSDLHLHNHKPFGLPAGDGLNSRALHGLNILLQLRDIAKEEELVALFFCGDFWETRGYVLTSLFKSAYSLMQDLCATVPVYAIGGNHDDATLEGSSVNAVELFEGIENFYNVHYRIMPIIKFNEIVYVTGISAGRDMSQSPATTNGKLKGNLCLLLHDTIANTEISKGYISPKGLPLEDLEQFMSKHSVGKCFIGDIHLRQQLTENIGYVGSCIQKTFGEDQQKGMLIWDTTEDELEFRHLDAPEFVTMTFESDKTPTKDWEHYTPFDDYNYWRVYPATMEQYNWLKEKSQWNARIIPPPAQINLKERSNIQLDESADSVVRQYVGMMVSKKREQQRLIKLGLELLQ